MKTQSLFLILIFFIISGFVITQTGNLPENEMIPSNRVEIESGVIEGIDDSGILIFKGIPFAKPPVDELRWTEPQKPEKWDNIRETKAFGPACMQLPVFGDMNFRSDGNSEDCLYLNVWTPSKTGNEKLPVLLYYYGGGFIAGDGSEPRYDGGYMARNHGIVAVTVNYRLGVFGFFAHPELTGESPNNSSGNYGLLDQAFGLQWVKNNIEQFGGDPDNITIAGESAGSIAVSAQMASPLSRNLIAGAIGESGSIMGALSAVPLDEAEQTGVQFADMLEKNSLEDLRSIPAEDLLQASGQPGVPRFSPTVDGYFFPKRPVDIYRNGEQADVPLFVGWNSLEMNYRMVMGQDEPTPEIYTEKVRELYGDNADRILELYPGSTVEEVIRSATDLAGDRFISYSTWKWSDLHSENSSNPVYRYFYTHPRPPMREEYADATPGLAGGVMENDNEDQPAEDDTIPEPVGAVHAAEIEYIMGNLPSNRVFDWTYDDYKVSQIFSGYAANFIKTKDPNGLGLPKWSAINRTETPKVIYIGTDTRLKEEEHRERYLFLDRLNYPE